jgi:hypothetical protein
MSRYQLVVLTQAHPGREADLRKWYDEHHLAEIMAVPGVVGGKRYDVELTKTGLASQPGWNSLAVYELEADDPRTVLDEISRRRQAGQLTWTDSLLGESTLQIVGRPA